ELLRGLENGGEEPERLLRVARLPAREQHLRVAELGAGEPWAGADARVHLEPALEVQGRLHPASHGRGEEPEVARDRPAAGDASTAGHPGTSGCCSTNAAAEASSSASRPWSRRAEKRWTPKVSMASWLARWPNSSASLASCSPSSKRPSRSARIAW